jgi:hypothetical protein
MWTVSADGTVIRRMRDDKMTPLMRYPHAAPYSAGLAFDGLYLWTLDGRSKVLSKHLVDRELSVIATYRWRGAKAAGLVYDGKSLWSLDAGQARLLRHSLDHPDEFSDAIPLPEYAEGLFTPVGAAWDGSRFWTVGEANDGKSPARLVRHQESR